MNDIGKLAQGAIFSLSGKLGGRAIIFFSQVYLARVLGPYNYGLYAIGLTVFRVAGLLAPLGLPRGVIKKATEYRTKDEGKFKGFIFSGLGMSLLWGSLVSVFVYLNASTIAISIFKDENLIPVIQIISTSIFLFSGTRVASATTKISKRIQYSMISEDLGQPISNLILIFIFISFGASVYAAIWANVISYLIAFILSVIAIWLIFPHIFQKNISAKPVLKELIIYSLPIAFTGVFGMLLVWTDRIMIGYFLSTTDVGIYQAIGQLSILFPVISGAFGAIMPPFIVELYEGNKMGQLGFLYKIATKWGLYISLPIFIFIALFTKEILLLLFGAEYVFGATSLQILILGQFVNVASGVCGLLLIMTGKQKSWLTINVLTFLLNFSLSVYLVPLFGIRGAAVSTSISIGMTFVLGVLKVNSTMGIWPYDTKVYKGVIAIIVSFAFLLVLRHTLMVPLLFKLLIAFVSSVSVFVIMILVLGLDKENKILINLMQTRWADRNN